MNFYVSRDKYSRADIKFARKRGGVTHCHVTPSSQPISYRLLTGVGGGGEGREIAGPIIKPSVDRSVWKRNFHGYSIHSRASYRCTHDNWFLTNVRTSNRDVLLLFLLFDPVPVLSPFFTISILFYNFISTRINFKREVRTGRINSIIINQKLRYLNRWCLYTVFLYIENLNHNNLWNWWYHINLF